MWLKPLVTSSFSATSYYLPLHSDSIRAYKQPLHSQQCATRRHHFAETTYTAAPTPFNRRDLKLRAHLPACRASCKPSRLRRLAVSVPHPSSFHPHFRLFISFFSSDNMLQRGPCGSPAHHRRAAKVGKTFYHFSGAKRTAARNLHQKFQPSSAAICFAYQKYLKNVSS